MMEGTVKEIRVMVELAPGVVYSIDKDCLGSIVVGN